MCDVEVDTSLPRKVFFFSVSLLTSYFLEIGSNDRSKVSVRLFVHDSYQAQPRKFLPLIRKALMLIIKVKHLTSPSAFSN